MYGNFLNTGNQEFTELFFSLRPKVLILLLIRFIRDCLFSVIVTQEVEAQKLFSFSMIKASGNFITWREGLRHGGRMGFRWKGPGSGRGGGAGGREGVGAWEGDSIVFIGV